MQGLAGRALAGKATIQMTMLKVNGLQNKDVGSEVIKKVPSAVTGRYVFENPMRVRRAVWGSTADMGKEYTTLGPIARCDRILSLHTTSAAPERNWSQWGKMYCKDRSSLAFTRAEKLIAVSSAAKLAYKDTKKTCEVQEMELLCVAVDESQFGNALVDTCFRCMRHLAFLP